MKVNTTVNKVNIYDHGLRKRAKASVKSARSYGVMEATLTGLKAKELEGSEAVSPPGAVF